MQNKTRMISYCSGMVWLKCLLLGSVIGYKHENETQKLAAAHVYVRWKSIHLCIRINSIYILQVRAYFIVSWDRSSFYSKKETINHSLIFILVSLYWHFCVKWGDCATKYTEALKHRVERRVHLDWLWINYKLTVGLRCQPFEVDTSSVSNTAIPRQNIRSTE